MYFSLAKAKFTKLKIDISELFKICEKLYIVELNEFLVSTLL